MGEGDCESSEARSMREIMLREKLCEGESMGMCECVEIIERSIGEVFGEVEWEG